MTGSHHYVVGAWCILVGALCDLVGALCDGSRGTVQHIGTEGPRDPRPSVGLRPRAGGRFARRP